MIDGFGKAYSEFKKVLLQSDQSIEQKLDDETWQEESRKRIEKIQGFLKATLIELKSDSLVLSIIDYSTSCILEKGVMSVPYQQRKDDAARMLNWNYGGFSFWNPIIVQGHLEHLDKCTPLEALLAEEPSFKAKVEKTCSDKWSSFLYDNGFLWRTDKAPDFEGFAEKGRVLVSKEARDRIEKAYNLIIAKERGLSGGKEEFAKRFPDFEAALEEVRDICFFVKETHNLFPFPRFYMNGNWCADELEKRGFTKAERDFLKGDVLVEHSDAEAVLNLLAEMRTVQFKKYAEIRAENPETERKMVYIRGNDAFLGKLRLAHLNFQTIKEMSDKDPIVSRSSSWKKYAPKRVEYVDSNKEYDSRIVGSVARLYDLMQVTDRVYAMISAHQSQDAFWSLVSGVVPEQPKYWAKDPYIREGKNFTKGNLLVLIEMTSDGEGSVADVLSGKSGSYAFDNHWYSLLEKHSKETEIKRDGTDKLIISEKQVYFFRSKLSELKGMITQAISDYKKSA